MRAGNDLPLVLHALYFLSMGTGGPLVENGARQTMARLPPRLGRAVHLQRDLRGMDQPGTTLPAARRGLVPGPGPGPTQTGLKLLQCTVFSR